MPEVLLALTKLDTSLPQTKLVNLKYFNQTYLIITKNMSKNIQSGNFKYKTETQQLIINFIHYYFKAIENYQNKQPVAKAWEIAFRFCEERRSNRLMYLVMGANAHINNDLSFALKNTIKNDGFYSDYQKIGEVIEFSIKESILVVNQQSPWLSFIDKHLILIYEIFIKFILKEWRRAAWNNYLKLRSNNKIENKIASIASRKAREISIISHLVPR